MYNILAVDDTEINLLMIKRLLEGLAVSVEKATGGEEALSILRDKTFDICLFDYQMPGMSGVELLNAMRELGDEYKGIPVVAMTGTEDENAAEFFTDLGFDIFLNKPISKEDLFNTLFDITGDPIFDEGSSVITEDEIKKVPEGVRAIEEIDFKVGIRNAGSADDYISAIKIFCKAIDDTADEIQKAFENGDMKTYTIKVHGLKSTARMVGAFGVSDMAAKLEEESKSLEEHDLKSETAELLSVYRGLHLKIMEAMKGSCQMDDAAKKRIDDAYITLKDYAELEDYDLIELVIDAMSRYNMPVEDTNRFKKMKSCLLNFDFEGIREVLKEVG